MLFTNFSSQINYGDGEFYQIKTMINIGNGKTDLSSSSKGSQFWRELLNSTQLISKNVSNFPEIKSCRLRMAYSKLQNNKANETHFNLANFEKTKGSFLLDKESKNSLKKRSEKNQLYGLAIFNEGSTRYNQNRNFSFDSGQLVRTIDVAEIKRIKKARRSDSPEINNFGTPKKSQQFSDYFKKVILNQRASNEISKFFSQGKGVDISDRSHFQKLERMKLSMLNRKIEDKEKSFLCVSTKLNKYDSFKTPELPVLPNKPAKLVKNASKTEQQKVPKDQGSSFVCEPWESDQIQHDIQLN